MNATPFQEARQLIARKVQAAYPVPRVETLPLMEVSGRILAQAVAGDRDYPPVDKSLRDGYAIRAAEVPGALEVIGELRAGNEPTQEVGPRQAVEIMTGAPIPVGADAVVMVERTRREGGVVYVQDEVEPGTAINEQGHEVRRGEIVLHPGHRLGYSEIGLLATFGYTQVQVFRKPSVAILSTGDEVVPISQVPNEAQVRNSNAWVLATQVRKSGGNPVVFPIVPDTPEALRLAIQEALKHDLLLFSGGVSAGKYDLVETVLAEFGAEFFITRVAIRPGQPFVFGKVKDRFFCGLPGNPGSTMITFEIFARGVVELLSGVPETRLPLLRGRLTKPLHEKPSSRDLFARLVES
ncbi:MAG: molybdopterin molybdotransferase MoeA [Bryobacterales bacterium]|nr:molybdopterin molybdotransferase MoeA [Bryobacterales bacterium]